MNAEVEAGMGKNRAQENGIFGKGGIVRQKGAGRRECLGAIMQKKWLLLQRI